MGTIKKNTENKENNGMIKDEKKEVVEEKDFTQHLLEHTFETMYLPSKFSDKFHDAIFGKKHKENTSM